MSESELVALRVELQAARDANQEHPYFALLQESRQRAERAEAALQDAREALRDWRHGSDWLGEGSGQMPDRVLILRLERLLLESDGSARAVLVEGARPEDTA